MDIFTRNKRFLLGALFPRKPAVVWRLATNKMGFPFSELPLNCTLKNLPAGAMSI